jgi:hypothetical protein
MGHILVKMLGKRVNTMPRQPRTVGQTLAIAANGTYCIATRQYPVPGAAEVGMAGQSGTADRRFSSAAVIMF